MHRRIWLLTLGFFGIQFAYGLQNSQASRVFQLLGATVEQIPFLWILAPILSLIALPLIGYLSDKTSAHWGRKPYIIVFTIISSLCVFLFPRSYTLAQAFILLGLMDLSVQLNFEQYRAFSSDVAGQTNTDKVFAWQSVFISAGAVISSLLPYVLDYVDISQHSEIQKVPTVVMASFVIGSMVLSLTIFLSIASNSERKVVNSKTEGIVAYHALPRIPKFFIHLSIIQFFSWLAFITIWIYFTPAITAAIFNAVDVQSDAFYEGANWTGVCFAYYNSIALLFAFMLEGIIKRFGRFKVHLFSMIFGGLGLATVIIATNKWHLLIGMTGIGLSWASLMSVPYSMLVDAIDSKNKGFFLNLLSYFVSIPKILAALLLGYFISFFNHNVMYAIILAACCFLFASFYMLINYRKFSTL